ELGKPAGQDLVEGVYTLPVIRAMGDASALRELLGRPLSAPEMEQARALVRSNGAVGLAVDVARGHAAEAVAALDGIDGEAADALRALAHNLVDSVAA